MMQKHFNTDFSVKTRHATPMTSTSSIEQYYPYTLESAGRADFYPEWSSSNSRKRKAAKKLKLLEQKMALLSETLQQIGEHSTEENTAEESAA